MDLTPLLFGNIIAYYINISQYHFENYYKININKVFGLSEIGKIKSYSQSFGMKYA